MRIIIIGSGFTGVALAKKLVAEQNNVTLIDSNEQTLRHVSSVIDCATISAEGNSIETLEEAGIAKADALVCLTSSDEVNMITCSLADALYPKVLKIARVRNYAYYVNTKQSTERHFDMFKEGHRPLYGIDYMIHPDVEAADAIYKAVSSGAVSNIISFDNSVMQISKIPITSKSVLLGHKLMELRGLSDVTMLIVYIEEDGETFLPTGSSIIKEGSFIGVMSKAEDLPKIIKLCGIEQKPLKKIAIIGAGRIGSLVAEQLLKNKGTSAVAALIDKSKRIKPKVVIIDNSEEKTKAASVKFPSADVFLGDATDEEFLNEEGIEKFDLAICATHNHELNMVLAAFLESLGVGQSMSLVTSGAFATIATKLGVDVSVSLRDVVVDTIMSHLRGKQVLNLHTLNEGELEIIECVLAMDAKVCGLKVKALSEHGKYLILLVKHREASDKDYEIANGETVITAGDNLVIITKASAAKEVLLMFQ